ncbi:hypothetical protein L484_013021 [Morus notabilis]|uniref:Uncharacterized protein n=1 Tax=Morus notabilis TaxID=981085 RepID=W9RVF3_9ROSA|nr:hypothetical protein L484_013021 [Morus notabilis]
MALHNYIRMHDKRDRYFQEIEDNLNIFVYEEHQLEDNVEEDEASLSQEVVEELEAPVKIQCWPNPRTPGRAELTPSMPLFCGFVGLSRFLIFAEKWLSIVEGSVCRYPISSFDCPSLDQEVQACGSMVTEEQPHAMLIPLEYFLMGYGLYRPTQSNVSPRSPLSPLCIAPELFSPESMGLKLKPIKTQISLQA